MEMKSATRSFSNTQKLNGNDIIPSLNENPTCNVSPRALYNGALKRNIKKFGKKACSKEIEKLKRLQKDWSQVKLELSECKSARNSVCQSKTVSSLHLIRYSQLSEGEDSFNCKTPTEELKLCRLNHKNSIVGPVLIPSGRASSEGTQHKFATAFKGAKGNNLPLSIEESSPKPRSAAKSLNKSKTIKCVDTTARKSKMSKKEGSSSCSNTPRNAKGALHSQKLLTVDRRENENKVGWHSKIERRIPTTTIDFSSAIFNSSSTLASAPSTSSSKIVPNNKGSDPPPEKTLESLIDKLSELYQQCKKVDPHTSQRRERETVSRSSTFALIPDIEETLRNLSKAAKEQRRAQAHYNKVKSETISQLKRIGGQRSSHAQS